jgi:CTP synthase (UTP-ammonia lyase)
LHGEEATVTVRPETLAARIMGTGRTTERYFCSYGLNIDYLAALEAHGLVVAGRDDDGAPRLAELPSNEFFLGSLFQPELSSDATWVHPILVAFAAAVRSHAASSVAATPR